MALSYPCPRKQKVRLGVRSNIDPMISEVENQNNTLERKEGKL